MGLLMLYQLIIKIRKLPKSKRGIKRKAWRILKIQLRFLVSPNSYLNAGSISLKSLVGGPLVDCDKSGPVIVNPAKQNGVTFKVGANT